MGVLYARTGGKWVPVAQGSADQRWFSAWGTVATGAFTFGDGTGWTPNSDLTAAINQSTLSGRRYRAVLRIRAVVVPGATLGIQCILNRDGALYTDRWVYLVGGISYGSIAADHIFDGDGATHSYKWSVGGGFTAGSINGWSGGGNWYIEDLGPVTGAAIIPPAPAITAWTNVTFQNGWQNAPGWQSMQYRMYGDKVELRGHIYAGTANSTAFQLPVGYRPPGLFQVPTGVTAGNATFGADGTVQSNVAAHVSVITQFSIST